MIGRTRVPLASVLVPGFIVMGFSYFVGACSADPSGTEDAIDSSVDGQIPPKFDANTSDVRDSAIATQDASDSATSLDPDAGADASDAANNTNGTILDGGYLDGAPLPDGAALPDGACNGFINAASPVVGMYSSMPAPPMTGGTITAGVYYLTAITEYDGTSGPITTYQGGIVIYPNGQVSFIATDYSTKVVHTETEFLTTNGFNATLTNVCGGGGGATNLTYSATATGVDFAALFGPNDLFVQSFTRQ